MSVGVLTPAPFTREARRAAQGGFPVFNIAGPVPRILDSIPNVFSVRGVMSATALEVLDIPLLAGRAFTQADATTMLAAQDVASSCNQSVRDAAVTCGPAPTVAGIINGALTLRPLAE